MITVINMIQNFKNKFSDKFENISRISIMMLIFGQFFILCVTLAALAHIAYILYIDKNLSALYDSLKTDQVLCRSLFEGLCIIWVGSLFIDYIEKNIDK